MKKITNDTEFTEIFLRKISSHLSGRVECKQIEYQIVISDNMNILMLPKEYQVFPNRYSKHEAAKSSVVSHVLSSHQMIGTPFKLVPGTYIYKLSVNKKQRRWLRQM